METNIHTNVGRLHLRSPLILGACPLTASSQVRLTAEANGVGAIVLPSLFEEQIWEWESRKGHTSIRNSTSCSYDAILQHGHNNLGWYNVETYLSFVNAASTISSVPIVASLNGNCVSAWQYIARELEECGASAIEINLDFGSLTNYATSAEIEDQWCQVASSLSKCVDIPIFFKLSRQVTSAGHLARKIISGVEGIVLYGRRPTYEISLDSYTLRSKWNLTNQSSVANILTELIEVHEICPLMPLVASGGFANSEHVIKALFAGADAVMITSAIYRSGVGIVRSILDGVVNYMEEKHIETISDIPALRPDPRTSIESRTEMVSSLSKDVVHPSAALNHISGDRWGHSD